MKKSHILSIACAVVILSGAFGIYDVFYEDRNFRIMNDNEVYRSAQLKGSDWQHFHDKYPFRSILNLRGENDGKDWYQGEIDFAEGKGIQHGDIALSADIEPDIATMEKLVKMMRESPKPLLIHCRQGADRSGLASALYAYSVDGKTEKEAAKQLSLYYGHFPWLTSKTGAMDRAFSKYVATHPQTAK